MPNPLLSTGDEGKNQDGHALGGAKDAILKSHKYHAIIINILSILIIFVERI